MRDQWLAMEHSRLHAVETWPDGPRKEAVLASIRSKLASLALAGECSLSRERPVRLVELRVSPVAPKTPVHVAA